MKYFSSSTCHEFTERISVFPVSILSNLKDKLAVTADGSLGDSTLKHFTKSKLMNPLKIIVSILITFQGVRGEVKGINLFDYGIITIGPYLNMHFGDEIDYVPGFEVSYFFFSGELPEIIPSANLGVERNFSRKYWQLYFESQITRLFQNSEEVYFIHGLTIGPTLTIDRFSNTEFGMQSCLWFLPPEIGGIPAVRLNYRKSQIHINAGLFLKVPLLYGTP